MDSLQEPGELDGPVYFLQLPVLLAYVTANFSQNFGVYRIVRKCLQRIFEKQREKGEDEAVNLSRLAVGKRKKESARLFYEILVRSVYLPIPIILHLSNLVDKERYQGSLLIERIPCSLLNVFIRYI